MSRHVTILAALLLCTLGAQAKMPTPEIECVSATVTGNAISVHVEISEHERLHAVKYYRTTFRWGRRRTSMIATTPMLNSAAWWANNIGDGNNVTITVELLNANYKAFCGVSTVVQITRIPTE